jgi:hypothetical protein
MLDLESLSSDLDHGFPPKVESLDRTQDVGYTFDWFVKKTQFVSKDRN